MFTFYLMTVFITLSIVALILALAALYWAKNEDVKFAAFLFIVVSLSVLVFSGTKCVEIAQRLDKQGVVR